MQLLPGLSIVELGLLHVPSKTLLLGDMHIGYDEALNRSGVLIPRFHFKELMALLERILDKAEPRRIIINGDIKHEFGTISEEEWRNILKMIDFLRGKAELFIIKGNHDAVLKPITDKRKVRLIDHYLLDDIYVCHGHEVPHNQDFQTAETVVMGHEHPAITLEDGIKREKYKCFLLGSFQRKKLVVMPSLNPVQTGSDVTQERLLSPLLKDLKEFEVIIVEDKPYRFGKVKQFITSPGGNSSR